MTRSEKYWAGQIAKALTGEGVERVKIVERMPHPGQREIGVLYIRPSAGGRRSKSRMERLTERYSRAEARRVAGLTDDAPWSIVRDRLAELGLAMVA